jgi:predicted RNA binding protein YcfA (HicA-like mRNA interferase family)
MKRKEVHRKLTKLGWYLKKNGSKHDVWTNGKETETVARHPDIPEYTARKILKTAKANPGKK